MEKPPSSPKQPEPKKLKMSTTSTTDDDDHHDIATDAAGAPLEKKIRFKRRKVAIFFAYCGVGYQGMQKNPGAKTIEGELEEALFFSGAVPEQDRGCPKRFDWARSARTDKGVSAVGQVVSGRFYIDPPGLIDRLNSILPPQIRMFGYKRVTGSFNAKKFCDRRRYVYLIPVFALDPCSHPDRESVLASLGSGNELVKCLECSERGRKVEGIMGKRSFEPRSESFDAISPDSSENIQFRTGVETGIPPNNGAAVLQTEVEEASAVISEANNTDDLNSDHPKGNGAAMNDSDISAMINSGRETDTGNLSSNGAAALHTEGEEATGVSLEENNHETLNSDPEGKKIEGGFDVDGNGDEGKAKSEFYYGEEERERFNRILKHYEGTHNFHNFTTRIKAEDPSARRYIISFNANTTVNVEGIEFVKCEVVGQSFMLHQIRKMVGFAVAIVRNCAQESLFETAFQRDVSINVPTAPEVGLYLDECFFTSYNQKWKDSHEEVSMKAYADEAEEFKMKYIYSHIALTEHKEGVVALWLHSLNHRNYPDLHIGRNEGTSDGKGAEPNPILE